jgi:CDP-glucose 4,6-dehydratase
LEDLELNKTFWKGRSVFITGHTGFKGGWLSLWLSKLGAKVYGYSIEPPTKPSFFDVINLKNRIENSIKGDVRNLSQITDSLRIAKPSIIFHMAAQSLVRKSYSDPVETFSTNVLGTVNILEASRKIETVEAIINITTDKCYENRGRNKAYNENDRLGGHDPYSSSKACSEIVTSAYRNSFFKKNKIKLASARAGNIIGGGDWAIDRLIPDFFRSIDNNSVLLIRSPQAVRPWQHVLDPLSGYLLLAEKLISSRNNFSESWNFGPEKSGAKTVTWIIDRLSKKFPGAKWKKENSNQYHESKLLKLDISKAKKKLGWMPRWALETAIENTIQWYQAFQDNQNMQEFSMKQINVYQKS